MPRVNLGNGYLADFPDEMSKDDISAALRKQFGGPRASDQPLSKGVESSGQLPGHAGNLDRSKAGDNWTTAEISEEGIPKHYILPTQPGDKPPSGDGIEMGDAVNRYLKTKQHYGAFDSDETAAAYMKGAAPPATPSGGEPPAAQGRSTAPGDAATPSDALTNSRQVAETSKMAGTPHPTTSAAQVAADIGSNIAGSAYAGIEGLGQGAFGVGDYAGAAGQLLGAQIKGEKITAKEAFDRAKAFREAAQADHPIASAVGTGAGVLATAPAFGGAVRAIPGVTRLLTPAIAAAGQSLSLGSKAANVARVGAEGGAAAAASAAATGQDPLQAGAEGAVISPVAAKAAQLGLAAGKKIVGLVSSGQAQSNAMEALAKRIGSTPAELRSAMDAFRTATGRPPTLAEIVDSGSAAELGKVADARKVAGDQFNRSAEQITQQRPANMQAQIESRGPTDTVANLTNIREDAMNAAMGRVEHIVVHVPPRDIDRFLDPDAARVLSRDLRARLNQAQISGRPAQLTVRDIDNMRIAFNDAADTGQRHVFYDLANRVGQIGATQVPSYGSALSEYSAFSRGIKGFEHGTKGTTPADLKSPLDIADAQSPEYSAGRNVGVRSRVAQAAGSSERGAVSTANDIRQNAGTATELRGALGARETNRLQAQGQAETQSARNLALTAPGAQATSDETARDIGDAIKTGIAAGGHASATYKAGVLARLVSNAKLSFLSNDAARRIAEASTNTARLPGVIDALRRARLNDEQIRAIFSPRAGVAAGTLVGEQEQ